MPELNYIACCHSSQKVSLVPTSVAEVKFVQCVSAAVRSNLICSWCAHTRTHWSVKDATPARPCACQILLTPQRMSPPVKHVRAADPL